LDTIKNLFTQG